MNKIIAFILLLSFVLTSCSGKTEEITNETETTAKYVKTALIQKKNFIEDLKLVWKVWSSQETVVSPLTSWNIKSVNVTIWDKVSKWDLLATIDTQTNLTNISLNNANSTYQNTLTVYNSTKEYLKINLETTKLQYENTIKTRDNTYSSTEKELQLAQANLDAITSQKTNTVKSNDSNINVAQKSCDNAKLTLDNFNKNAEETIKSLNNQKKTKFDSMKVSIDTSIATFDSAITYVDTILWVTNKNKELNNQYEIYISAKDTSFKTKAETNFNDVYNSFGSIKWLYENNNDLWESELLTYYSKIIDLNDKLVVLFDKMVSVLDNSITSSTLTESTLSTYKTTIKSYQSEIISLKSTLTSLKNWLTDVENTIKSTTTSNDTQRASYEQAIKIAQSNLENTIASTQTSNDNLSSSENTTQIQLESTIESIKSSRDNADNSVAVAKSQYESALANYNSSLASSKSQLDTASWNKNTYEQQLNNAFIKAPIDWIIIEKNIDIWTSVSSAMQAFSISNSSKKVIKLDVTSENINFFKIWQEVKLGKNDKTATWTVSVVWASTDTTTWMYKIEISFHDKSFNDYLWLWDYIDVFVKKFVSDAQYLIIPFTSLLVWSNETYSVYVVWEDNKVQEKKVTIWDSNSSEIVITSWLKDWDRVIVEWALNVAVWDEAKEM